MENNKMNPEKNIKTLEKISTEKQVSKERSPYMSKDIYNNYAKTMKEKNQKRKEQKIKAIYIRTFEEWSSV